MFLLTAKQRKRDYEVADVQPDCTDCRETWTRGYKTFFMLNSVEHEILNAHKYKNIKKFSFCRLR